MHTPQDLATILNTHRTPPPMIRNAQTIDLLHELAVRYARQHTQNSDRLERIDELTAENEALQRDLDTMTYSDIVQELCYRIINNIEETKKQYTTLKGLDPSTAALAAADEIIGIIHQEINNTN